MRKTLAGYGVTGRHGPSRGKWHHWRRAGKRYFHKVTAGRREIKRRRKLGRRGL